jgi:hypothetical protein
VIPSKSFEPDMKYLFKLSILHVLFKTFGWNLPVCSNYLFFMFCSKLLDGKNRQVEYKGWFHPKVLNQTWSTDKLNIKGDSIQTFWTRQVLTNWTYRKIQSKSLESDKKSPCMFNLFVLLVRFQTFGLNLPVCSICQYLMSGSKHKLNIQGDSI